MELEQKIENISGNLKDAYKQAVPGTLLHVDQLMKERQTNQELRDLWFYTVDGNVYSMDGGTPTWRITREAVQSPSGLIILNPVLKNIDEAFEQLVNIKNYHVSQADFEAVKAAPNTLAIDLTRLRLRGDDQEWQGLVVDTSKALNRYNEEEQNVLLRIYGPTEQDYAANMKMLRTSPQKINKTTIYVPTPDYVREKAEEGPIGRASWLYYFGNDSDFFAIDRFVGSDCRLRGVRRVIATGDAEKNEVPPAPQEKKK